MSHNAEYYFLFFPLNINATEITFHWNRIDSTNWCVNTGIKERAKVLSKIIFQQKRCIRTLWWQLFGWKKRLLYIKNTRNVQRIVYHLSKRKEKNRKLCLRASRLNKKAIFSAPRRNKSIGRLGDQIKPATIINFVAIGSATCRRPGSLSPV